MKRASCLLLTLLTLVSSMPLPTAFAQVGPGTGVEPILDLILDQVDNVLEQPLPGGFTAEELLDEVDARIREVERVIEDAENQTLRQVEDLERFVGNQTGPYEDILREYQRAVESRVNSTREAVVRNVSALRSTVNDTALLGVFVDPVDRAADPPVVGRNTERYYSFPSAESTSFTAPSIQINRTTWDFAPDVWLHWALGEDRRAMDDLGLPYLAPADALRAGFPGGYPGDSWRVEVDDVTGNEVWTFNDRTTGVPARNARTELVTPVIDLRSLPRVDTDEYDDVAEEGLNLDPDDLADRIRDEGAEVVRVGQEAFLALGDVYVCASEDVDPQGQPDLAGPTIGAGADRCRDRDQVAVEVNDTRANVETGEGILNRTIDQQDLRPAQKRLVDRLIGPLREPLRIAERTLDGAGGTLAETVIGVRNAVRGALDPYAEPGERDQAEAEVALAQVIVRHRFDLQPGDDGANVQLSLFDPERNTWTPWKLLRPTAGPLYDSTSLDEEGDEIAATPARPALVSLQDRRQAWGGEALNPRGLGWTNSTEGFVDSTFDLTAYAGFEVRIRFYAATSSARPFPLPQEGWYIDSVRVQALAHPLEVGIAQQIVPVAGALVLPFEEVPIVAKVRNYGKLAIDTVASCLFAEHDDDFESSDVSCGSVVLHLEPAQEQVVEFQSVKLGVDRDGRVTIRLLQPAGDGVLPFTTVVDAQTSNNRLVSVFRAEEFVDHAIARVEAVPLEEIETGIQAEGAPWRILVTVENRGNAPIVVGPADLNITIEDADTGAEIANVTAIGGSVTIPRGSAMTGPGLGTTANRHTFAAQYAAPLPDLYRVIVEVDASREDRRAGNDEGVTFLPVRHANTGAFQDELTQGFRVLDLHVKPDDTISYRSEPVVVRDNHTHDDMLDRQLVASGAWWGPPTLPDAEGADGTYHWFRYQGKTGGDNRRELDPGQNPLVLSATDRVVTFDVWGPIAQGAFLDVKWCESIAAACGENDPNNVADNPVVNPADWLLLQSVVPGGPSAHIDAKDASWQTYSFKLPGDEARGYLAFVWKPGNDGRGILIDDVELPLPLPPVGEAEDPLKPGRTIDTVDYRGLGNAEVPAGYEFHTLELDPDALAPNNVPFERLKPEDIPRFLDDHILFEVRTADNVGGDMDHLAFGFKGHVLHDSMMVIHAGPGAVRSLELPEPAEDDWHRGDGSGSLWWGAAEDRVRSDASSRIEFGPVDLRDAKKGNVNVSYRGWLADADADVSIQWRPFEGGPWSGLGSIDQLPMIPPEDDPGRLASTEKKLGQMAGRQVMLRVTITTPVEGTFTREDPEVKPFEIVSIIFTRGEEEQERVLVRLGFDDIPGLLDGGASFRQGREQLDEDAWYKLFGTPIAPTDGEAYFAAFPKFPAPQGDDTGVAGLSGGGKGSYRDLVRPLIRKTLCLEDPIDLTWAARPQLTFDQKIFLNSRAEPHTGYNDITTFDVALVQVRVISGANAAVDVQQPPGKKPGEPVPVNDRLPTIIVDQEVPPGTVPQQVPLTFKQGPPACDSEIGATIGSALPAARTRETRDWVTVRAFKDTRLDAAWTKEAVDLSSFAGETIQVRFVFALSAYWARLEHRPVVVDAPNLLQDPAQDGDERITVDVVEVEYQSVENARNHTAHWFVDRLRVVSPDGRTYAPLDANEEAATWDLDGAGPHAGALQQDELRNPWKRAYFFEPFDRAGYYASGADDNAVPIASFRDEDGNVRQHPTLWHERDVPGVGPAYVFGRDQLPGTFGVYGFWAEEVAAENNSVELGGQGPDFVSEAFAFAPAQRLVTPIVDTGNLSQPILILRHAYNGSFLANDTNRRANACVPPACGQGWKDIAYVVEGRYERFDGAWSPWTILRQNLNRPDEAPVAFRGDSGRQFPTLATDRLELGSLLPSDATGRIQLALRAMAPFSSRNFPQDSARGFVNGGWIIESLRVADGRVANDVALLRVRLDPVVGRLLKDDLNNDGVPDLILPPASSLSLNVTAANRGIFGQDRVGINISWGHQTYREEIALASDRQRGASVRSIDIPGLATPRVPPRAGELNTSAFAHHVNITLELAVPDELLGDNTIRIPAVVAGIRAARIERLRVLPLVEEQNAQRLLALDLSNEGNVILGPTGPLPGATRLEMLLSCRSTDGVETTSVLAVAGLPPVPPRGPGEPARPLPPVPIPPDLVPDSGDCRVETTFFLDEHELTSATTTFAVKPELGGDVIDRESLDTWTRSGLLADAWNLTRDDTFSAPYAFRYTAVPGKSGSAVLESPELPANLAVGGTSLVFTYNATLGVGDLATVEVLRDGDWRRLAWPDPDNANAPRVREISGAEDLKIVTIPNFGVRPAVVDIMPPARIPGAGRLEVVPVLDYEPELSDLGENADRAVEDRFASTDASVVLPVNGDKMWFVSRADLARDEVSDLIRDVPPLPDRACLSVTWRAELLPSAVNDRDDRFLVRLVTIDDDGIEQFSDPIFEAVAGDRGDLADDPFWDWTTTGVQLDAGGALADVVGVAMSLHRRAGGTGPARGVWIDGLELREGSCTTRGAGLDGEGFVSGLDASEDATRREHALGVGWRLVPETRSGQPFAFSSDGRASERSIGAFKNAGLAANVNATLFLPILDLTRSVGNETALGFYAKQDLTSGRDAWWIEYSSRRAGERWSDWTFLPLLDLGGVHPFLTTAARVANLVCSPSGANDVCVGAYSEVPFRAQTAADPDPGRLAVFTGRDVANDPWRSVGIDLTRFQGREVRMAIRLATDADGPSRGVLFDDFTLTTEVLQGAVTKVRFVVESGGRSEGSTLVVDHLRLLGDRADTNLALRFAGIDGVDLLDRGRINGTLYVVQPGAVTFLDLEVTNKGRLPACNTNGLLATTQLRPGGAVNFDPVGWSIRRCLAPGERTSVSVPLVRDASGPLEVPDVDLDEDRVPASADPSPIEHLEYRVTAALTTDPGDDSPEDDTAFIGLLAKPVRTVRADLKLKDVTPRVVDAAGSVAIATELVSDAPVALPVTVRPILVDASPSHDNGWGEGDEQQWEDPTEFTGEEYGLDARVLGVAPGDRPVLAWTLTNLTEVPPGLYTLVVETIVPEEGLLPEERIRRGGAPIWVDARPIYLRNSFEGMLVNGVLDEGEWGALTTLQLAQVADPTVKRNLQYGLVIEQDTLFGVVVLDDYDFTGFSTLLVTLEDEPEARFEEPGDGIRLSFSQNGPGVSSGDVVWWEVTECNDTNVPDANKWCRDDQVGVDGVTGEDQLTAYGVYDPVNRVQVVEFSRPLRTTDEIDVSLEPGGEVRTAFALFDAPAAVHAQADEDLLYLWPADANPYSIVLDPATATADVSDWAPLLLPEAGGLPPVGDTAVTDGNPFANVEGGEGVPPYWRGSNGDWRWQDNLYGTCGNTCADGGGEFTFRPAGGDSGVGDGAYVYTGRVEDNGLDTDDALVSPAFMLKASQLEGAILRFTHRYAFEGRLTGGNVQLQLAEWTEENGDADGDGQPDANPPNDQAPGGYWTFANQPWEALGPAFRPPHERGAGGRSPDGLDEMMLDADDPGNPCPDGTPYTPGCEPLVVDDQRVWGNTFASDGWATTRIDLADSLSCEFWESRIARRLLALPTERRACFGTRSYADDKAIYDQDDFAGRAAGLQNARDNGTAEAGDEYYRPLIPARVRFAVGSDASDGVASAVWAIDDVSISAYDPLVSVVRTVRDPFNLTLLEGEGQVLELVVRNNAQVPDVVAIEAGYRGARAPGWTIGVLADDGNVLETAERALAPGEEWRAPILVRPSVGVLAPDQQYLFRVLFTARSLADPLAASSVTFNVKHATSLHPELIVTEVKPRTQGRLSTELGAGAFEGVPVTVQGTIVNLGVQDADSVQVALEVRDPHGNVTRVPAPNGADALTVRLLTGGGGLARVAFEWRPQATGLHTLTLIADPDNAQSEANELNNRRSTTLDVLPLPLPDLEVVDLQVVSPEGTRIDGSIAESQLVHVIATILNSGLSAAKDVRVEFRGGRELFWTERGGALSSVEPGQRVRVLAPWSAYTAGGRDVELTALALFTPGEGGLFDADVDDNTLERFVVVDKPAVDLRTSRAALDTRPDAVVKVPLTVANGGNSVDTLKLITSAPEPLRAAFFPATEIPLAPGHQVDGALVLVIPPLTPPGTYDLVVKVQSGVGQSTDEQRIAVEVRPSAAFAAITATPNLPPDGGDVELRILNTGNERLAGSLTIGVPDGYEIVGSLPNVNLVPGEAASYVARVRPTTVADAGELTLSLGVEGVPAAVKDVRLEVRSEGRVHVELAEPVALTQDEANDVLLTVTNAGNLPVEARLSSDLAPELGRVEGLPTTIALEPGDTSTLSVTVIPRTSFEELPVRVVTAWENKVVGLAASADLPDLTVLGIDLAADPVQGESVVALVRVGNAGTSPSPPSTVSLYVDDVLAATGTVEAIAPGEERIARVALTPLGGIQGLTAIVDEAAAVREGAEANNAHHVTIDAETPGVIGSLRRAVPAPGFTVLLAAVLGAAMMSRWGLGGGGRRK